jgi:uncharacterized membrane-anchored protein
MEIKITLQNLLKELNSKGLLSNNKFQSITTNQNEIWPPNSSPWYVRALMVFGAWIASLFFVLGLFLLDLLRSEESFFVYGIVSILGGLILRRGSKQFFLTQFALALSVTGHLLVFANLARVFGDSLAIVFGAVALSLVLYLPYNDPVHRFLSPFSAIAVTAFWISSEKYHSLFHFLLVFELLMTAILFTNPKINSTFRPLAYAFAISIPGTLLLILLGDPKTFLFRYIFNDEFFVKHLEWLIDKFIFFIALVWLYQWVAGGLDKLKKDPLRGGVIVTLFLGLISTPGILAALWLMILGYALRERILISLSIAFFPIFISLFYYDLELTLDIKAYILLGSGIIFLIMRLGLKRFKQEEAEKLNIIENVPTNPRSHSLWSSIAVLVLIFFVVNGLTIQKISVLENGKTVLLRLAPVDPRSLIQGDYMTLTYEVYDQFDTEQLKDLPHNGQIVVKLNQNSVATFLRFYQGGELANDEQLINYFIKKNEYSSRMRIGAESFFFQEGHANYYSAARYGELKVDSKGNSVLVGLRGEKFEILGAKQVK